MHRGPVSLDSDLESIDEALSSDKEDTFSDKNKQLVFGQEYSREEQGKKSAGGALSTNNQLGSPSYMNGSQKSNLPSICHLSKLDERSIDDKMN